MVIRGGDRPTGESSADLLAWLAALPGGQPIATTRLLTCDRHGDEPQPWQYLEADPAEGVARRRCLSCAHVVYALDSDERWTHPPMYACPGCGHSIVEVAAGLSTPEPDTVSWVVLGVRCAECGRLAGATDLVVAGRPVDQVLAEL